MSGTLTQSQLQALRTLKASFSVLADEFEGIKDTMDADFALQLSLIIGDDESESEGDVVGVSLTQEQIENLRTLRDQYNDLLTLIGESTDTASAATIFGKLAAVIGALADMQGELPDVTLSSIADDIDETRNDILDKFDDLDDVIGSPATGQASTLFGALADIGAGVPMLTIPDSTASQELAPNVVYVFASRTSALTLTLGNAITGVVNEYHFFIECGATAPTVTFPTGITWNGGSAPTIAADKTYEVSIMNNIAAYFEV